ncbi:MAG: acylphosphatase [Candidatus Andersenbacteria bacterium]|nr:acylphosphatase [Candidatus Andersenbacteria bacterium]
MFKRIHLLIIGKVQNVFYRVNAKRKAKELDLTGWVRNISDDRVEILADGEEINLEKMIDWCHDGSDNAIVDRVEVKWEKYEEKFDKFRILV